MRRAPAALGLIMALAACDGGGDPVNQALRDASAANHAATVREGTVTQGRVSATEPAAVQTAAGATADAAYISEMIAHHRAAVATAEAALRDSRDPSVRRLARDVVDSRNREIAELQAWTPAPSN